MKMRTFLLCFFAIFFLIFSPKAMAGSFNLKSISGVDTSGKQLSHWWYSGTNVVFNGEAIPGSSVGVTIDDKTENVTADATGDWSYNAGDLPEGDHQISLLSEGSKIDFILTTGKNNVDWEAVGSGKGEALPTAGTAWPGIILLAVGTVAILMGGKMWSVRKA